MARLGARAGVPVVEDLGSGAPVDLAEYGLPHERTIREALGDGISLVAFSGDKLLGGPQAGIVAGRAELVARLRNNPLLRALRVDKTAIAALAATLQLHRSPETRARIPLYRMLGATMEDLWERARRYCDAIAGLRTVEHRAVVGGGALPGSTLASLAIAVSTDDPGRVAAALRRGKPPVVARLDDGRVLLDLRTIAPEEDGEVLAALLALR
jgi:L-seryl-tRNA(Ser) seleniumtransferase